MSLPKNGTLIVFSGLPASGKTTLSSKLAAHLQATYIRVDSIVFALKEETKTPDLPTKCYKVARSLTLENLKIGNVVITDSVNAYSEAREEWNNVAKSTNAVSLHIEVICSNKEEHQLRLKNRTTTIAGLENPTWKEVQELDYHNWHQERILLDTSGKTIEDSFKELVVCLKNKIPSLA